MRRIPLIDACIANDRGRPTEGRKNGQVASALPIIFNADINSMAMMTKDPKVSHASSALARHRQLSKSLHAPRKKWDLVVLQSWRDDLKGDKSLYVQYAPKYTELIKNQGGRVVLYETTPTTQNSVPLTAPPDPAPVTAKARTIASLAQWPTT